MPPAGVDGNGVDATEVTAAADTEGQGNTVKLGRWWQLDRQELPQLQQAVQLLL
jgi:hypothetical protein